MYNNIYWKLATRRKNKNYLKGEVTVKKTKRTLITAAILTAAAINPKMAADVSASDKQMSAVYGPPWALAAKGDVNWDNEVNILDYCLMKNAALGKGSYTENEIADINRDGKVNGIDIKSLQYYLINKTSEVVTFLDEPQPQTSYGCFPTYTNDEVD